MLGDRYSSPVPYSVAEACLFDLAWPNSSHVTAFPQISGILTRSSCLCVRVFVSPIMGTSVDEKPWEGRITFVVYLELLIVLCVFEIA